MLNKSMDLEDAEKKRDAIRRFMAWREINLSQWCKKAGAPYSTVNSFLTGKSNDITYGTLEKLASAYDNVTVDMIMGASGFKDTPQRGYEAMPADIQRIARDPEAMKIAIQALDLDEREKRMVYGMLQSLPKDEHPQKAKSDQQKTTTKTRTSPAKK